MKKLLAILLTVMVVLSCFAACGNNTPEELTFPDDGKLRVPDAAYEYVNDTDYNVYRNFVAVDLEGNKYDESIFKGKKLTMINIWATFCRPCINEMPALEQLSKDYRDEDFQIIGFISDVDYNGETFVYDEALLGKAQEIIDMTGVTYLNLLPSLSLIDIKLETVYTVPETIFVDENGNVVGDSYIGSRTYEGWKEIVDSLLAHM